MQSNHFIMLKSGSSPLNVWINWISKVKSILPFEHKKQIQNAEIACKKKWENHSSRLLFLNNKTTSAQLVHAHKKKKKKKKKKSPFHSLSCSPFIPANSHPSWETTRLHCFKMDARHVRFFLFHNSSLMSKSCFFLFNLFSLSARSLLSSKFSPLTYLCVPLPH